MWPYVTLYTRSHGTSSVSRSAGYICPSLGAIRSSRPTCNLNSLLSTRHRTFLTLKIQFRNLFFVEGLLFCCIDIVSSLVLPEECRRPPLDDLDLSALAASQSPSALAPALAPAPRSLFVACAPYRARNSLRPRWLTAPIWMLQSRRIPLPLTRRCTTRTRSHC